MPNENKDLDEILAQMSSINNEDYWFKKVSDVKDEEVSTQNSSEQKQ